MTNRVSGWILILASIVVSGFPVSANHSGAIRQSKDKSPAATQKSETPQAASSAPKSLPTSRRLAAIMDWEQAKAWTKAYLEGMPAEHYSFKPVPEIRTFAEQLLHASQSTFSLGALATDRKNPYDGKEFSEDKDLQQKDGTIKRVLESYDFLISGLRSTTDEKLNEVVLTRRGTVLAPKWELLQWAFTNQTHHRGQTTIYLRLKGIVPPPQPSI